MSRFRPALRLLLPTAAIGTPSLQEFLPAALEVQERPPAPAARYILRVILSLIVLTVVWAALARVDIVVAARGKLVPSGQVKVIQPLENGVVRRILVAEGTIVEPGQALIELDAVRADADTTRLGAELKDSLEDAARMERVLAALGSRGAVAPDSDALLRAQMEQQRATLAALDGELAKLRAALGGAVQAHARAEETLPLVRERAAALEKLARDGLSSRVSYLELKEREVGLTREVQIQAQAIAEAEAGLAALTERRRSTEAELRRAVLERREEATRRAAALTAELSKARSVSELLVLRSPVRGTVTNLVVHTVGGVVTAAQPVLEVVPDSAAPVVQVLIENKDVGYVRVGQPVRVKVDAFPFTDHGTLAGRLMTISGNATVDEQLGLVYPAWVELDATSNPLAARLVEGMQMTAEVTAGRRSVLEYFLDPIRKRADEALGER